MNGTPLGTIGDVGLFSLGRGKNITCGSGGIVLTRNPEIARALDHVVAELAGPGSASAASFLTLLALSVLVSPLLYWFPAGLPFLRLGETIFHDDFPVRRLSRFQALLLRDWQRHLSALDAIRRRNTSHYAAHIDGAWQDRRGIACLRFPVVLSDAARKQRLLNEQDGTALGICSMYPASVARIPRLQGRLREYDFPRAERVARSLVTLPTHPLVSARDRARICAAVNAVQSHARGVHETTGAQVAHVSGRL
jgi:dTDP-4-amino-4,6-dideoxygalactose transaminase